MSTTLSGRIAVPFALALLGAVLGAQQAKPAPAQRPTKPWKLEQRLTEELTLPDLAGKNHELFAEHPRRALLLVFWSWRDPVSRFYAPYLAELQRTHAETLTLVLVDSNHDELVSAGEPLKKLAEVLEAESIRLPVLLDHGNRLADDFDAIANGQVFLIDANRFLRYQGGIDDDPKGVRQKAGLAPRTWLANALAEVLAGERPKEPWTRAAGRPIKRAPVPPPAPVGRPK